MAKRTLPAAVVERTAHFIIYEARSGDIVAVHHVTALPGVKVPSDAFVQKRVLACAAEALDRDAAALRLLATAEAPTMAPGMRVDVTTRVLSKAQTQRGAAPKDRTDRSPVVHVTGKLRSP
jgi:hypothetical protein